MKVNTWILMSTFVIAMATELRAETSGPSAESVRLFLMATYSNEYTSSEAETGIRGPHFPRDRVISGIKAPLLKEMLPETAFFTTTIRRPDYDYQEVDILVAATRRDRENTFQTTFIPPFTKFSPAFFEVFQDCDTTKVDSPKAISVAIGELVTSVDPKLDFRVENNSEKNLWEVRFQRSGKLWSTINVYVDDSGRISKVAVAENKKKRPYF